MRADFKFEFGDILQDKITLIKGVVVELAIRHDGVATVGICPQQPSSEYTEPPWIWMPEARLKKVGHISITNNLREV